MHLVLDVVAGLDRRLVRFCVVALVCVAASSLLSGCQTTDAATAETATAAAAGPIPRGKARLVLVRESAYYAVAVPAVVKVNGQDVANLASGGSASVMISPGPTAVNIDAWSAPGSYTVNLDAKAGRTYRIEISPRTEAIAPALICGLACGLIEAADNEGKAGAFKARVVSE